MAARQRIEEMAEQNHWTERGRAASVSKLDATGRPRRSVLWFAESKTTRQRRISETHRTSCEKVAPKVFDSVPQQYREGFSRSCGDGPGQRSGLSFASEGHGPSPDRVVQQDADVDRMPDHRACFEIETMRTRSLHTTPNEVVLLHDPGNRLLAQVAFDFRLHRQFRFV